MTTMVNRGKRVPLLAQLTVQALAVCGVLSLTSACVASEAPVVIPAPAVDTAKAAGPLQKAVLSGGCFWGVQGVFEHLVGVHKVVSGYSGGESKTAQYETVSGGNTGHAESVEITFDPQEVSYGQILQVFFSVTHDPTQLNRQGPDTGTQYRSSIFYADENQKKIAQDYIAQLTKAGAFHGAIVTRVDPLKGFYPAEAYHQDFLIHNPSYPYIVINDLPKIRNFKQTLPALYRDKPVLLTAAR
ncbi:MAG TPA: peptide-methionine (S)-S-oxide reductase MsrA [Steroidobacteraceae bacterium]|jgi:peptide-methionine (S)-S-oxide reductase